MKPFQWPLPSSGPRDTPRLYTDKRFFTPSGKAQFIATAAASPFHGTDDAYPLILNTGRVRDHWHTLTRTGKSVRLSQHRNEPFVQVHPEDALSAGLRDGGLARIESRWGTYLGRVDVDHSLRRGEVFVPMHWNDQFAAQGRADGLVNPVVDPVSGEPEFKHTPVRILAYDTAWQGFILSRTPLQLDGLGYWSRLRGEQHWQYTCADPKDEADWPARARTMFAGLGGEYDWLEFYDRRTGRYRCALMQAQQLQACLFVEARSALPARDWLASLFAKAALNPKERNSLLSASLINGGTDPSPLVCSCFQVRRQQIIDTIHEDGLRSEQAIGAKLKAGTNCGSCLPELRSLLADAGKLDTEGTKTTAGDHSAQTRRTCN